MTTEHTMTVVGEPVAQDRPRARNMGAHATVYDSGRARPWRALVIDAAVQHKLAGLHLDVPLGVRVVFRLSRPQSHFGTGKNCGNLKASAPTFVARKPDIDNFLKSTFDAMTEAMVWRDDSLVCAVHTDKRFVGDGELPGCTIAIWKLDDIGTRNGWYRASG